MKSKGILVAVVSLLIVGVAVLLPFALPGNTPNTAGAAPELVGTMDNYISLMNDFQQRNNSSHNGGWDLLERDTAAPSWPPVPESSAPSLDESKSSNDSSNDSPGGNPDHSKTNTQVEGVDEADIIKNDGEYIYTVNASGLSIVKAWPVEQMRLVGGVTYENTNFRPREIYIDGNLLIALGSSWTKVPYNPYHSDETTEKPNIGVPEDPAEASPYVYYKYIYSAKVIVYDISDKANPQVIREAELEGDLLSSRKIGSCLYFVTNKSFYYYDVPENEEDILPRYSDSIEGEGQNLIGFDSIYYFPNFQSTNFMTVAGLDLSDIDSKLNFSTYMGSGQNIYVSADNMYVASAVWGYGGFFVRSFYCETEIFKFALKNGEAQYVATGTINGCILNQFSMDEHKGYLRVATTTGKANSLYVLDGELNIVGDITNIAPGEQIKSVRFMGERGYMVTFVQTDPLFAIDLKDPKNPKVMGELKIPGYSTYLHPYDENHLIGFGYDTEVNENGGVLTLGLKLAIFDVTDITNPIEMYVEKIGDRGSSSPLLYDHKALLFDKEKGLLAIPVTVYDTKDANGAEWFYPVFTFQGVYVYDISLDKGFQLKGEISQLDTDDMARVGANYDKFIERVVYIGQNFYTLSPGYLMASDMATFATKGIVQLVSKENKYDYYYNK
ncbi:MAG: beta-propeller domain-containing protein [Clostridiales bacterium]|nr:beta-propeller domain-containing protein [Clostridiales bacterium]